jgi:hypothetical protein
MMHFENYHWEDHVPRAGSWKLNLALGALAFGLISYAMPNNPNEHLANHAAIVKPAAAVNLSALELQRRAEPAAFTGQGDRSAQCPYADS